MTEYDFSDTDAEEGPGIAAWIVIAFAFLAGTCVGGPIGFMLAGGW